jgi:TPM domain
VRRALLALALVAALAPLGAAGAKLERSDRPGTGGFLAIPPLSGPVVDTTGTLSAETRRRIEALALEVQQKTGAELAVLLVRSTQPEDAFSYGMRVAEAWKLGKRAGRSGPNFGGGDNGLLFLVALDDRRMHMLGAWARSSTGSWCPRSAPATSTAASTAACVRPPR